MPDVDQVLVIEGPGQAAVRTEPAAPLTDGSFRVHTLYSGCLRARSSASVKGTNPSLSARFDGELGLFRRGQGQAAYPIANSATWRSAVAASRSRRIAEGAPVAMTYGHRSGYRGDPLGDRVVPLPADLDPVLGIYVAHMGPICANGLLHAAAELHGTDVRGLADGVRGRRVAVTGAGVVGLLTALFARRHGAAEVVLVEPTPQRRAAPPRSVSRRCNPTSTTRPSS